MRAWTRIAALTGMVLLLMVSGAAAQAANGKPATVTGRVVDNMCILGMGLEGDGHRERKVLAIKEVQAPRAGANPCAAKNPCGVKK